ncbi:hypothetical protein TNIN_393011 [Trichonephila inaurata madagascariensis]|uniref:Uncharacterized protein n=1 Tax=Trichonephila inaurata madagascariensis TaxID=2747483 RepID=A0A8X7BVK9_9ARAC|nr:hypothetical protein TNIN_393011 [Trichonephila inaurata madagascariensis]
MRFTYVASYTSTRETPAPLCRAPNLFEDTLGHIGSVADPTSCRPFLILISRIDESEATSPVLSVIKSYGLNASRPHFIHFIYYVERRKALVLPYIYRGQTLVTY